MNYSLGLRKTVVIRWLYRDATCVKVSENVLPPTLEPFVKPHDISKAASDRVSHRRLFIQLLEPLYSPTISAI